MDCLVYLLYGRVWAKYWDSIMWLSVIWTSFQSTSVARATWGRAQRSSCQPLSTQMSTFLAIHRNCCGWETASLPDEPWGEATTHTPNKGGAGHPAWPAVEWLSSGCAGSSWAQAKTTSSLHFPQELQSSQKVEEVLGEACWTDCPLEGLGYRTGTMSWFSSLQPQNWKIAVGGEGYS